jgi:hemerythrin-like domain-containing protein
VKTPIDPFAHLMKEHESLLVQLKKLNSSVSCIAKEGYRRAELKKIRSILKFLGEEVSVHNKSEEEALFPVVEKFVEGPTQLLRKEHKKLRVMFDKLVDAVNKVETHPDSFSAVKNLSVAARQIAQLFVNHIHKENHILFPMARRFLSTEGLREIARRMA